MLKVAITGNIASGKSTVEKFLKLKGFPVYDTDIIAHEILNQSQEIKNVFKNEDIWENNIPNRQKLAKIVFADKNKLKLLESIIHPEVEKIILKIFKNEELKNTVVFISVPQLFETGLERLFDKIICISADKNIRKQRLMSRNNITKLEAELRIASQMEDSLKIKKSNYVIFNNSDEKNLIFETDKILSDIFNDI